MFTQQVFQRRRNFESVVAGMTVDSQQDSNSVSVISDLVLSLLNYLVVSRYSGILKDTSHLFRGQL